MSSFLSGPIMVAAQTLHSSSADKLHGFGEVVFSNDGRAFRYCGAGATALVAGQLQQSPAQDTGTQNLTAVAAAVDDLSIVSTTTVTVTLNEYAEGFILISVTPGVGRNYKIKGHAAFTAAAPTFAMAEPVRVALTTTSRFDAIGNPFNDLIVAPTTYTASVAGAAVHPIAIDEFGWCQVGGIANLLADGALVVGEPVIRSNGTAGSVEPTTTTFTVQGYVGYAKQGVTTTEYGAVDLQLL